MQDNKLDRIIEQIAKEKHTTTEDIRKQMQDAMELAMKSKNPKVQKRWASIPRAGEKPTLEELIAYISKKLPG